MRAVSFDRVGGKLGPIPVKLLGLVEAPGELIREGAAEQWLRPELPQVSAVVGREVLTFDKEDLLPGRAIPSRRVPVDSDDATSFSDGSVVFITGSSAIRAVAVDGQILWETVHCPGCSLRIRR